MPEPTPEQKRNTIRLAHKMMENMFAQVAPDLKEYVENQRELHALAHGGRRQEPQETPDEQRRLRDLLDTVKNQNEEKTQ